ncbi:MAG: peptidoglycan recognition family protein [Planctomycetota bacterium]
MKKGSERKRVRLATMGLAAALLAALVVLVTVGRPGPQADPAARWREDVAFELGSLARGQWGASEKVELNIALGDPRRITVHHSGGGVFSAIGRASVGRAIKAIQDTHMGSKGWDDIGYHFIVDPAGRVWEGRHLDRIGAHAGSQALNLGNIGVLVLGNFDLQQATPAQLGRLEEMLSRLQVRFGIADREIYTHNGIRTLEGLGPTACPGRHLSEWLKSRKEN